MVPKGRKKGGKKFGIMLNFCIVLVVSVFCIVGNLCAAGKYVLAMWRELGAHENSGKRVIFVWVFDENGNPVPGVHCYTSWGVDQGVTNEYGRCEIELKKEEGGRDVMIVDDKGSESDVTPFMTSQKNPYWGHYSYECIFLFKSDVNNPGVFNTQIVGTVDEPAPYGGEWDWEVAHTRSITYKWFNYETAGVEVREGGGGDNVELGQWSGEIGQTFVANGNRVWCVMFHGVIGDNFRLNWTAQILEGGPDGKPVGPPVSLGTERDPILFPAVWPITDMPQTEPGKTYYLKITRAGGLNYYRSTQDNYQQGTAYENQSPVSGGRDIKALVIEMNYTSPGSTGEIKGTIRDASTSIPIDDVRIQITSGPATYIATSQRDGTYRRTLPVGIYNITVSKQGYLSQEKSNIVVSEGQVVEVNFNLERDPSVTPIVLSFENSSFESGLLKWERQPSNATYTEDTATAHTGTRSAKITYTGNEGEWAHLWQATATDTINAGQFYKFWVWVKTDNVSKIADYAHGASLRIGWADNYFQDHIRDDWVEGPVGTNDWTKISVIAQAPKGAQRLQVALFLHLAKGTVWFDDVNTAEGLTDSTPPPVPVLQSPMDNATVSSLPCTFDWSDVNDSGTGGSNPCMYHIQIDNDVAFSSPEVDQFWLSQSEYTLSSLPNGTYYWRVRAKDSVGNTSSWSSVYKVIINVGVISLPKRNIIKVKPNFIIGKVAAKDVKLEYHVSTRGNVYIRVYSIDGKLVKEIIRYNKSPGRYEERWNMEDDEGVELPSGIYFVYYTAEAAETVETTEVEKVIYVK